MQPDVGIPSDMDDQLSPLNPYQPTIAKHGQLYTWLSTFANSKSFNVLELGSRSVTGPAHWMHHVPNCTYTGFDYLEGQNVDVVGDIHDLSNYFEPEKFEIVISQAVFEHLAMPWLVAEEISKVLKVGGLIGIETHFSFSQHELPWHFFQFNSHALECLFNKALGFEIVDSGLDTPMVARFANSASPYLVGQPIGQLYCHSSIIARKVRNVLTKDQHFDWRAALPSVIEGTSYPLNTGYSRDS